MADGAASSAAVRRWHGARWAAPTRPQLGREAAPRVAPRAHALSTRATTWVLRGRARGAPAAPRKSESLFAVVEVPDADHAAGGPRRRQPSSHALGVRRGLEDVAERVPARRPPAAERVRVALRRRRGARRGPRSRRAASAAAELACAWRAPRTRRRSGAGPGAPAAGRAAVRRGTTRSRRRRSSACARRGPRARSSRRPARRAPGARPSRASRRRRGRWTATTSRSKLAHRSDARRRGVAADAVRGGRQAPAPREHVDAAAHGVDGARARRRREQHVRAAAAAHAPVAARARVPADAVRGGRQALDLRERFDVVVQRARAGTAAHPLRGAARAERQRAAGAAVADAVARARRGRQPGRRGAAAAARPGRRGRRDAVHDDFRRRRVRPKRLSSATARGAQGRRCRIIGCRAALAWGALGSRTRRRTLYARET